MVIKYRNKLKRSLDPLWDPTFSTELCSVRLLNIRKLKDISYSLQRNNVKVTLLPSWDFAEIIGIFYEGLGPFIKDTFN